MKPTTKYNYLEAVTSDVLDYIKTEIDLSEWKGNTEGLAEHLNDELWCCDSVTGNASGSYTFSTWKAEECLLHNWGELAEALDEFGCGDTNPLKKGAEWCDVTLRCYYLARAIENAIECFEDELSDEED